MLYIQRGLYLHDLEVSSILGAVTAALISHRAANLYLTVSSLHEGAFWCAAHAGECSDE